MSSSSRKYYYYNTTKWDYTATNGGGRSSRNAAKNNSTAPKETTRTPMQAKKEKPLSKLHDLLSYGVKPWDPDADDFYEALQEARRKMDAQQDQDDSKTDSLTGRHHTNSKREGADTKAGGSSSRNYGKNENNNKVPKATTISVNEQANERPMSKFEDLLTYGVKPWDSDADDFYEGLLKARGKFESCQIEDHEFEAWEYQDSEIQPWQDEDSENSEIELWEDEDSVDSEIEPWEEDEDSD